MPVAVGLFVVLEIVRGYFEGNRRVFPARNLSCKQGDLLEVSSEDWSQAPSFPTTRVQHLACS